MPLNQNFMLDFARTSGVARGVKWGYAPWGAGLGGATAHSLQSF